MQIVAPKMGSSVRVTVRAKNIYYRTYEQQPYIYKVYEGIILPLEKWENREQTFNMSGDRHIAVRNIQMKNVVSVENIKAQKLSSVRVFNVLSKKKNYTVTYDIKDGTIKCDCTGFGYRKQCKHSTAVLVKIKGNRDAF